MIAAILFDKDGTLFDFERSWSAWAAGILQELSGGDAAAAHRLADAIGYDLPGGRFHAHSVAIAGTSDDIASALLPDLPDLSRGDLVARLNAAAATAPMVETVPLVPLLDGLRARGLALGLATNGAETEARAHLEQAGILAHFDYVAGFDSGYGAKPGPGMCHAFAETLDLDGTRTVMVGDSLHDLHAGRAAGMRTLAVLTGLADAETLAPHAEAVLPDIGHLPGWLDGLATPESGPSGPNTTKSVAI